MPELCPIDDILNDKKSSTIDFSIGYEIQTGMRDFKKIRGECAGFTDFSLAQKLLLVLHSRGCLNKLRYLLIFYQIISIILFR